MAGADARPPVHAACAGERTAGGRFVPHGRTLAAGGQHGGEPLHEIILQPVRVDGSEPLHHRPAVGTLLPLRHLHLVAADMDVGRGEQLADFAEDLFEQGVVFLACDAPRRAVVGPGRRDGVGRIAAADFGPDRTDAAAVAREVDFGDDFDVAQGGVLDQRAHFVLRVITAVLLRPFAVDGRHGRIAAAETADFGQLGVRLDLDAPPVVVGQVEVEFVDVVVGKQVDKTF